MNGLYFSSFLVQYGCDDCEIGNNYSISINYNNGEFHDSKKCLCNHFDFIIYWNFYKNSFEFLVEFLCKKCGKKDNIIINNKEFTENAANHHQKCQCGQGNLNIMILLLEDNFKSFDINQDQRVNEEENPKKEEGVDMNKSGGMKVDNPLYLSANQMNQKEEKKEDNSFSLFSDNDFSQNDNQNNTGVGQNNININNPNYFFNAQNNTNAYNPQYFNNIPNNMNMNNPNNFNINLNNINTYNPKYFNNNLNNTNVNNPNNYFNNNQNFNPLTQNKNYMSNSNNNQFNHNNNINPNYFGNQPYQPINNNISNQNYNNINNNHNIQLIFVENGSNYPISVKKDMIFAAVIRELFNNYPILRSKKINNFICNGNPLIEHETIQNNNLNHGDKIIINNF